MDALSFTDAATFASLVGPVVEQYPAFASVLASNLDQSLHLPDGRTHWFLVRDGERPIAAAMHTPPFPLFVTPFPDAALGPALTALAEAVERACPQVPGVSGPVAVVEQFAAVWCARTGASSRVEESERVYEIGAPPPVPSVPGAARPVTEADLGPAVDWIREFNQEALPAAAAADPEWIVRRRLARGTLLLWQVDGTPVSMAGVSRPIAGVSRVGAVYTPKPQRRRGFGAAVTVAATRAGFAGGAGRVILYADLANLTSNHVYQQIGYRPVGDGTVVAFT